jgi:type VI secretion system protein ImpC
VAGHPSLPEAACIGLASPRVLLRMPYGRKPRPPNASSSKRCRQKPPRKWFVWGNPLFACIQLLGTAFHEEGGTFIPMLTAKSTGFRCTYKESGRR